MSRQSVSADELVEIIRNASSGNRIIAAVAGPPGSGKSTLADALVERLNAIEAGSAAVLPMDGYHYDDMVLVPRGLRPRKGAPETFDVAGFRHMLKRLKANDEPEIAVPVFDRSIEIARAGARMIGREVRYLVAEGNYLLLDEDRWRELKDCYDITVMIEEPEVVLRARLKERWKALTGQALIDKIDGNDLPNGRRVMTGSVDPDYVVSAS
ncbi:nucleoside/nucleotide kinase family protein [Rhizobium sp. NRK18]|uniref:nucleoside/nucleotide kinase family protein n=1 Tax=Rhizobium sp. NRK18 TaxID=2964667 RepID=UPI0021C439F2|nr:nucleoside/nucleotide kinase family protein [Rhizobium sp. NRK18]MCQ2005870.1 nucleoside/nucleotide kinase family protein [Rhizobium sp. NRK18]